MALQFHASWFDQSGSHGTGEATKHFMRWKRLAVILAISASFMSCTLFKDSYSKSLTDNVENTDSISVVYNRAIDSTIMNADKIRLYDMVAYVDRDTINHDSIFNFPIKEYIGLLSTEEKAVLSFILSDRDWYIQDYAPVRHPFNPNIAFEFSYKDSKAYVLVSFASEEIAISYAEGTLRYYQMRDIHPLARWSAMKFPEDEYYRILANR